MAQTEQQTAILELIKQLAGNTGFNTDTSLNLPGLDIDVGIGIGGSGSTGTTPPTPPTTPTTLRDVLLGLVNEQVQITTPFGMVTGTLLVVKNDYIVMIENAGDQVLVRIDKIELVSEL
ncbi:hypothetical protein JOC34_002099 [Virgibacillus halotolerans]|uniref:DUF2642 domain-containing protein n=1 Tax=Virgibacillus halotolerans TaxID=1071053 RepID=UPI001960F91E|nr:DUF2642 domain-containing protein [Virgibacillus halotolerans]MBM7599731.1 hypothetical protein [Virgibacillus halotolerans]